MLTLLVDSLRRTKIAAAPYAGAVKALGLMARALPGRPEIWPRNSYVLGTLVPFLSDLDITVWYENPPSLEGAKALRSSFAALAKTMPWLGEANVYAAEEARAYEALVNPFELARDPKLASMLVDQTRNVVVSRSALRARAGVFLLRMLEGDIRNVMSKPESRRAKWDSHFDSVRSALGPASFEPIWSGYPERPLLRGIVLAIGQVAFDRSDDRFLQSALAILELYSECSGRGLPPHLLRPLYESEPLLYHLAPHRFIYDRASGAPPAELLEWAKAQIEWELWGVVSQWRLEVAQGRAERLDDHLKRIAFYAEAVLGERSLAELAKSLLVRLRDAR